MRISDWSSDVCSSDLTFLGLNLLGYLAPSDWTVRPYLLGNVHGHSLKFLSERTGGGGVGAGLGAFFNLSQNLDVRLEGRYNLDFVNGKGPVADDTFYLWTATAGLRWKFGSDPNADEGDGVPNSRDKRSEESRGGKEGVRQCK